MGRRTHPPEGPEPDYYCPKCSSAVMGSRCSNCELGYEEAEVAYLKEMDHKLNRFEEMLEEQDGFNLKPKHLGEVEYEGRSLRIYPRFRFSIKELLEMPGVKDTYTTGDREDGLVVNYKPDEELSRDNISYIVDDVQILASTLGVRATGEYVRYHLQGKDEYANKVGDKQWRRIGRLAELLKIRQ